MNTSAVFHKTSEQMSYAFTREDLVINLRTGYDVDQVFLIWGDPYQAGIAGGAEVWSGQREEIVFKKRLADHIWWTTTVRPQYRRCRYYFELHAGEEVLLYFEDGFLTPQQAQIPGRMLQYFTVPWMNPADVNETPSWVNDTVWYQIFPDRFCRADDSPAEEGLHPWVSGPAKNEDRYGGNLRGITQRLPYLEELGITGLYLTPVNLSPSNHKYDTTDYERIDPHFGTELDMIELVSEAHRHGMRVMMDGVFNHCGENFAPWQDVLKKGPQSAYWDWFMINKWPVDLERTDPHGGEFFTFAFYGNMPKLNTNNPEVIRYIVTVCAGWVKRYDIDGIRFDVGNEVSHRLLKELREVLKRIKPDIYLIGEIWHNASQWLLGDEYDSVMNYPLMSSINDFFIDPSNTKEDFEYRVNRCYTNYQQQVNNVLFNLLDSHDTDRLITRTGSLDTFIQELTALFTMPGSVCIYYGTEIAMEGGHDPDCRRVMPWDEMDTPERKKVRDLVRTLIALRESEATMRSLYFHFPNSIGPDRCVEYIKLTGEGEMIQVILNASKEPVEIPAGEEQLFSWKFDEGQHLLAPGGALIRHYSEQMRREEEQA